MFYVEIKRPIYLKGEKQQLGDEIKRLYGVNPGIHLVQEGKIHGEKGDADYWHYFHLVDTLPTYRTKLKTLPLKSAPNQGIQYIQIDLINKSGLLLEENVMVELHEVNKLSDKEEGNYLLLCKRRNVFIQVIAK